mmetsp:Transcript_67506/g.197477  ORF Transcript_67506/g.197477 Transcript_67506/m.197477 type:complete len:376 (+) Transcript_67506:70-1197(+)
MAANEPLIPDHGLSNDSFGSDDGSEGRRHVTPEERAIVNRCLNAVEARGQQLERKGLTKNKFIFGVANSLFVAWSFGAVPEHFWIIYVGEVLVLFPLRWQSQVTATPLKQHFYWFDFCWVANFLLVGAMLSLVAASGSFLDADVSLDLRRRVFSAAWGLGCGPLLLATGAVGNALIFHDMDNTASVLIHLFPSLVLYVMGWQGARVHEAWPRIFLLSYFDGLMPFRDIFVNASLVYSMWLVLYVLWLFLHGMKLPDKGYDTIFHANMRGGFGSAIAKALKTPREEYKGMCVANCFPRSYALLYMLGHALLVYVAICFSLLCFLNKYIHGGMCAMMTLVTIYNGASRYTFYMIKNYGIVLRHELGIPLNRKASALY